MVGDTYCKFSFREVYPELKKDILLYGFTLITCLVTLLIHYFYKDSIIYNYQLLDYFGRLFGCFKGIFIAWSIYFYFKMALNKEDGLFFKYFKTMKSMLSNYNSVILFIVRLALLNICISNYTYLKQIIPDINPFRYDSLFTYFDTIIHLGNIPWEVTHSIFSNSYWTLFFNFAYNLWFILIWGSVLYFMWFCRKSYIRQVYLLSFFMTWFLIGGVLAIIMSSAGPCFVNLINPDDVTYVPLMNRLHEQIDSLWLLQIYGGETSQLQSYLWTAYINRSSDIGAGISAMPSMHVSSSVLLALGGFKVNRKLGIILWLFAVIIMIASVHLGWHYAIDSYVAILATVILWKLSQLIVKKLLFSDVKSGVDLYGIENVYLTSERR